MTSPTDVGVPVDVDSLTKSYGGDVPALDDVSVSIEPGSTLCVLGPSGCGKSTLLRLVAGLEMPDAGQVRLGDRVLSRPGHVVAPERRGVNMVFQDYALWPHLRVRDIVGYGLRFGAHRVPERERTARVDHLVEFLRLGGLEDRLPAEISGGQQQRVAIARALATSPDLLLLDEPLSNLDVQLRATMREELSVLLAGLGTTALYVTHDVSEALALADRILVLHQGRVVQLDTPHGIFARPRSGWTANLAGFSSVLVLDDAHAVADGTARGSAGGRTLVGRDCGQDATTGAPGDAARAYVHPDAVRLGGADAAVAGTVTACVFEGWTYRVRLSLGDAGSLVLASDRRLERGEAARVDIDPDGVLVFGARPRATVRGRTSDGGQERPAEAGERDRHAVLR
ncbi:ABC transporter ATP-binding protein [Oerskovia flava]|uniref:ABC transporter ATP-binding protein n=1 Tax=Oerskovia flava TaxID=2986422 RepID=UPI0022403C42|nr:ABC transporter ATP-binding protein [Oerskovia sp. JB1-3-2]